MAAVATMVPHIDSTCIRPSYLPHRPCADKATLRQLWCAFCSLQLAWFSDASALRFQSIPASRHSTLRTTPTLTRLRRGHASLHAHGYTQKMRAVLQHGPTQTEASPAGDSPAYAGAALGQLRAKHRWLATAHVRHCGSVSRSEAYLREQSKPFVTSYRTAMVRRNIASRPARPRTSAAVRSDNLKGTKLDSIAVQMVATFLSILAVDFHAYPRRFAKAKAYPTQPTVRIPAGFPRKMPPAPLHGGGAAAPHVLRRPFIADRDVGD